MVVNLVINLLPCIVNGQLNFAVLGNWGAGNWAQKNVASKLAEYCEASKCSFVVSPGSNFIGGVTDLRDESYLTKFVSVYSDKMTLPMYSTLGQEDWRGSVTSEALWSQLQQGQIGDDNEQVQRDLAVMGTEESNASAIPFSQKEVANYSAPKFVLPNWYWHNTVHFSEASNNLIFGASDSTALFLYIDTYILSSSFPNEDIRLDAWNNLKASLAAAKDAFDWLIVVGDTAIYSSGKMGSNKEMEMNLRPLLKENGVDAYISGNDYDMELMEDGSMALLNCGNGSYGSSKGLWAAPGSKAFSGSVGFCGIKLSKTS